MPYRYLEDIALADEAFEAWGASLEELLVSAAQAVLNIMVSNPDSVRPRAYRHIRIEDESLDMLLFQLLQELIYYKDAEQLLLQIQNIRLERQGSRWIGFVELAGETINPQRHDLVVDIKAITLHRLDVRQTAEGWAATVTVDV